MIKSMLLMNLVLNKNIAVYINKDIMCLKSCTCIDVFCMKCFKVIRSSKATQVHKILSLKENRSLRLSRFVSMKNLSHSTSLMQ